MKITKASELLEQEFRAAKWVHNRLLDFEVEHQAVLDRAAPKLARVGRLISRLSRRERWREKTHGWKPALRSELLKRLIELKNELKKERDASSAWRAAKGWADEHLEPKVCRRKKGETAEQFAARQAKAGRTRREVWALEVYAQRRCHWGTFNLVKASVQQALKDVLKRRKKGLAAELNRPSASRGQIGVSRNGKSISAGILDYGRRRMRIKMRIGGASEYMEFEAGGSGKLPELPSDYQLMEVKMQRERDGARIGWIYWVTLTVRGSWETKRGRLRGSLEHDVSREGRSKTG